MGEDDGEVEDIVVGATDGIVLLAEKGIDDGIGKDDGEVEGTDDGAAARTVLLAEEGIDNGLLLVSLGADPSHASQVYSSHRLFEDTFISYPSTYDDNDDE